MESDWLTESSDMSRVDRDLPEGKSRVNSGEFETGRPVHHEHPEIARRKSQNENRRGIPAPKEGGRGAATLGSS